MQVDDLYILRMSLFHTCFSKKSQLLGLPVSGTLVENGLKKHVKKWIGFQKTATVQVKKENTTFT